MDHSNQNRKALQHILEADGYQCEEMSGNSDTFFHAISHQLKGKLAGKDTKTIVMKHIDENKDRYGEMNDELLYWATSEALNVTIILYRSDYESPSAYEAENPVAQCFLGYVVDSHYVSLKEIPNETSPSSVHLNDNDDSSNEKQTSTRTQWFNKVTNLVDKAKGWNQHLLNRFSTQPVNRDLHADFQRFEQQIIKEFQTDAIIRNPCYLMLETDTMMEKLFTWTNSFQHCLSYVPFVESNVVTIDQVMDRLERPKRLDPIFAFDASIKYGFTLLYQGKLPSDYKVKAKSYLTHAQKQIGEHILPQLYSMQLESTKSPDEFVFDDLAKQIQTKVEIIDLYQNHLARAIVVIEESQKLIDITDTNGHEQKIARKLYRHEVEEFIRTCRGSNDISFHHLSVHHDCGRHDQAIQLLDQLSTDERVSIHLTETKLEAMDTITMLPKSKMVRLNIQYLDVDEVVRLISQNCANLTLTASSVENYTLAIEKINRNVTFITDASRITLSSPEAKDQISKCIDQIKSILFQSTTLNEFQTMQDKMVQPNYALTFNSLQFSQVKEILKTVSKPFSVEFRDLTIAQAKSIAKKIDDRQNFVVTVLNLKENRAETIVKSFDLKEQDVKASFKRLTDQFSKTDQPHEELNTYNMLGIRVLIIVDELGPRPWISATIVLALGVGQLIGGGCIAAITCRLGVSLGISLIGEGINDNVYGVRGAISRRCSWKDYGIQKGVSLAICFVTLGCSAVKQAAKAAGITGTTSLIKATGRGTFTIVKNSFKTIGSGSIKGISSNSWKLACQQVAVTCIETGVRQIANYTLNVGFNQVLSAFTESIRTEVERVLVTAQTSSDYERVVNRAIVADQFHGNKQWRQQIELVALQLMSKQKNEYVEALKSISNGVTNAILNHTRQFLQETKSSSGTQTSDQYLQVPQLMMTVPPMIKGSHDLTVVTDKFFTAYKKELLLLEPKIPTFEDLIVLNSSSTISTEDATKIIKHLVERQILTTTGALDCRFTRLTDDPDFSGHSSFLSNPSALVRSFQDKLRAELQAITFDSDTQRNHVEGVLIKLLKPEQQSLTLPMLNKKSSTFLSNKSARSFMGLSLLR